MSFVVGFAVQVAGYGNGGGSDSWRSRDCEWG